MKKKSFRCLLILLIIMIVSIFFLSNKSFAITTGWVKENGVWYCYDENGNKKTNGKYKIGDDYYFFDSNGAMRTKGWYNDGTEEYPSWYYITESGACKQEWGKFDGKWYYFQKNLGLMISNTSYNVNGKVYLFDELGAMISKNGWCKREYEYGRIEWYYLDGDIARTGWQKIDGIDYYFNKWNGEMASSPEIVYENDNDSIGKLYCFDIYGKWIKNPKGWYEEKYNYKEYVNSYWYYFKDQYGVRGEWINDKGKYYYLNEDGTLQVVPFIDENGKSWCVDSSGAWIENPSNGWFRVKENEYENWWYIENGQIVTGWKKISGKWYYFDTYDGMMYKNREARIEEKFYSFNESGAMYENSWKKTTIVSTLQDGSKVPYYILEYYGSDGAKIDKKNCWAYIDGNYFYFDENGSLVRGKSKQINGKYYGFDNSGVCFMKKGWNSMKAFVHSGSQGKSIFKEAWYWVDNSNGELKVDNWISDGGKWYYVDSDGQMLAEQCKYLNKDNCYYAFDENGVMMTNNWFGWRVYYSYGSYNEESTIWFYLGTDGKCIKNSWKKRGNDWCYLGMGGQALKGEIRNIDEKFYAFDDDSKMISNLGWNTFKDNTGTLKTVYVNNSNGELLRSSWVDDKYFNAGGVMCQNTIVLGSDNHNFHAFDENGYIIKNNWFKFYHELWNEELNNFETISDWVWADKDGNLYKNQWLEKDGYTYYFGIDCYMVTGSQEIDGKQYTFDDQGHLISGTRP